MLNFYIFSLKNSDDLFCLVIYLPFFTVFYPSRLLPLRISQHYTPFSTSIHTHMLFSTFLQLATLSECCIHHLFILKSSLHKQPFITAHFRSSLQILCITAH